VTQVRHLSQVGGHFPPRWWQTVCHLSDFRHLNPLPADFRFHDLRHYYASLLIASARREGGPDADAAPVSDHDAQHVRALVARLGWQHSGRDQQCDRGPEWSPCGQSADWEGRL